MERTIPYYTDIIVPNSISQGKSVLIASSENAIRGLLMHLCEVPETDPALLLPSVTINRNSLYRSFSRSYISFSHS
jgi:bisphosphoglycerate-dependent phosphoglycerate mutase